MAIAARAVDRVRAILAFITFGHRSVEFSAQHPVALFVMRIFAHTGNNLFT
jgi:hypothetical protein